MHEMFLEKNVISTQAHLWAFYWPLVFKVKSEEGKISLRVVWRKDTKGLRKFTN